MWKRGDNIQGRTLYKGGHYLRKYGIYLKCHYYCKAISNLWSIHNLIKGADKMRGLFKVAYKYLVLSTLHEGTDQYRGSSLCTIFGILKKSYYVKFVLVVINRAYNYLNCRYNTKPFQEVVFCSFLWKVQAQIWGGPNGSEKCKCNAKRKEGKAFYSQSAPVPREALFWIIDFLLHLNFCAENCIKRSALPCSVGSSWSSSQTRPVTLLEFSKYMYTRFSLLWFPLTGFSVTLELLFRKLHQGPWTLVSRLNLLEQLAN